MINKLITALSQELELSAEEIADTIWLALQIDQFSSELTVTQNLERDPPKPLQTPLKESDPPQPPFLSGELDQETVKNQSPEEQKAGIYPRNQQQTSKTSGLSLKVPDAFSLREPLTLARALKPLMRRVASGRELVLDEVATTQQIADKGLWIPILKPTLEPWLDLELVIDESISMQIWRHTIKELERLLKNYGIFRDVRVWGLITNDNEQIQIRRGIGATAKNQSPRSPKELIDPSGRRLVLVVSDCVSSLWRSGKVIPVLELWAKQGAMAILQMLPKWMWKRTALGRASEVKLQGLNPGVFNQNLIAQSVSLWDELDGGVKVPVFTLEVDRAETWALMLSGKGSIWASGYVFKLETIPVKNESELLNLASDLSAEYRVQGFRVTASPMARKLAGLLASAPVITLPIVRLIQEIFLKDSLQVNVAEVFLGGLLKPLSEINPETNPDLVQYDFMEGVRELLLDSVPSNYVLNVVDEVSKYVAKKLGFSLEDFAAVLKKEQPVINSDIVEEVGYFATVTAQVLRRLGGEYAKFAEELEGGNKVDLSTEVEVTPQDEETQQKIAESIKVIKTTRSENTRRWAAETLGKIGVGNPQAIAGLIELIETTDDEDTRRQAAETLGEIDPGNHQVIAGLVKLIETTQDENTRRQAAETLGKIGVGNPQAIAVLVKLIKTTQDKNTRRQAAESLGKIGVGNPQAIAGLVKLIETTQNRNIRWQAAETLGKIGVGNPQAIARLVKLIETTQDENTRRQAAESLGKIDPGNHQAIAGLVKLIETTQDENTRRQAAESLGKIDPGNHQAIAGLVKLIETTQNENIRLRAIESLEKIDPGNPQIIAGLVKVIKTTDDENTRRQAAETLGKIDPGNELAIRELIRVLETTDNEFTRRKVAESLGEIDPGNKLAIQALIRVLETTDNEETCWIVADNLGEPGYF